MHRRDVLLRFLSLLLVCALSAVPAVAVRASSETVLGNGGELFTVVAGSFDELFPDGAGIPAGTPVLALDVVGLDESPQRLLVPGTEGVESDRAATLVLEPLSGALFVVWERRLNPSESGLFLNSFQAGSWGEPIEISGDLAPLKGAPEVVVRHDEYSLPATDGGNPVTGIRTVLSVVWWEWDGEDEKVYYTPVVLQGGVYIGWNPVLSLDALIEGDPVKAGEGIGLELLRAPRVDSGVDVDSMVVGFVDGITGRLVTFEIRLLPVELGVIADNLETMVLETGYGGGGDRLAAIRDKLRAQIIGIGRGMNPGAVGHFAKLSVEAVDEIGAAAPDLPLDQLARRLRAQIIGIGARLLGGLERMPAASQVEVVDVEGGGVGGDASHLIRVTSKLSIPAPPAGQGPAQIFLSEDAQRVLVGWAEGGAIFYTESTVHDPDAGPQAGHWTGVRELANGSMLELQEIEQILRSRVHARR